MVQGFLPSTDWLPFVSLLFKKKHRGSSGSSTVGVPVQKCERPLCISYLMLFGCVIHGPDANMKNLRANQSISFSVQTRLNMMSWFGFDTVCFMQQWCPRAIRKRPA